MEKMITELTGKIKFDSFAKETKSESKRPYLIMENGDKILLYKNNDNPFENKGFAEFENKKVLVSGEINDNTFVVTQVVLKEEAGK